LTKTGFYLINPQASYKARRNTDASEEGYFFPRKISHR
jgi:hypothetical protein